MAKGFQCDKCGTWYKGDPVPLSTPEARWMFDVSTPEGSIEFHGFPSVSLTPLTWRGEDFCRLCRNGAMVDVLSQWIQKLQHEEATPLEPAK